MSWKNSGLQASGVHLYSLSPTLKSSKVTARDRATSMGESLGKDRSPVNAKSNSNSRYEVRQTSCLPL